MILLLLLAQGLRVCVHGLGDDAGHHASAGVTHLESSLASDDGDGVAGPAWHESVVIALKQLGSKFESLAVIGALLILPLHQVTRRLPVPPATAAPLTSFRALRPQLRAPPL